MQSRLSSVLSGPQLVGPGNAGGGPLTKRKFSREIESEISIDPSSLMSAASAQVGEPPPENK